MKVLDPGHLFQLDSLDGDFYQELRFVKREGEKFPGNVGHYPGTTLQEVIRALISRIEYLDKQVPCWENEMIIAYLSSSLFLLEQRAAKRHGRKLSSEDKQNVVSGKGKCMTCGHLGCQGHFNELRKTIGKYKEDFNPHQEYSPIISEPGEFTIHDSQYGHCALCGKLGCSGGCFK